MWLSENQDPSHRYTMQYAYLLWYTLFLDAQASLAGKPEAGSFVWAYRMQGSALPTWPSLQSLRQLIDSGAAGLTAVFGISKYVCTRLVELSQLALRVRADVELNHDTVVEQQLCLTSFRNELHSSWNLKFPAFLPRDSTEASVTLPLLARTIFDFASPQYSTAMVYLHTSMYSDQQMHTSSLQRREFAFHCRYILEMAAHVVTARNTEQHHIAFFVFLAGVASRNDHDKSRALGIMRTMEGTGISHNATESRKLLEAVFSEQRCRVELGGSAVEVESSLPAIATVLPVWPTPTPRISTVNYEFANTTSEENVWVPVAYILTAYKNVMD
ncbi:hypothetical protein E4T52_14733 [Aureobasidium sp. EXF-3400]|nr:hypothetical protein E4T52_14733 [Aureobasidium sp. EXF-3400]